MKQVKLNAPTIPLLSNVTGGWLTLTAATDPGYYAQQLRCCVRFADGVQQLFANPDQTPPPCDLNPFIPHSYHIHTTFGCYPVDVQKTIRAGKGNPLRLSLQEEYQILSYSF